MRYIIPGLLSAVLLAGCAESPSTTSNGTDDGEQTAATTVNQICPIMGGEVADDGGTAQWNGKLIGFCCPGCAPKWEKLSDDEKAAKLAEADTKASGAHADHHHGNDQS